MPDIYDALYAAESRILFLNKQHFQALARQ